ncbi:hypothetical protein JR316_0011075 [Psilocybe cubensis]|uniref:F-box domain-containing protein n=2 Tax=Psilocybe cubensis TaxID=181762 RepID=A0A8H7XP88_PSICU|nr:hypothetical protein JR316_0011075 [Psilocybe cubensis]KAH9477158.1 hypothetical protein JR316_0011075 [Psilocybe cubensis]
MSKDQETSINYITRSDHIHRLPLEVLALMFELCVGKDEQDNHLVEIYEVFPLGAVCKTWRYTAWTTASLWTRLRFKFGSRTTESKVQLAMEWLMRSGELPLDVYLSDTESTLFAGAYGMEKFRVGYIPSPLLPRLLPRVKPLLSCLGRGIFPGTLGQVLPSIYPPFAVNPTLAQHFR